MISLFQVDHRADSKVNCDTLLRHSASLLVIALQTHDGRAQTTYDVDGLGQAAWDKVGSELALDEDVGSDTQV